MSAASAQEQPQRSPQQATRPQLVSWLLRQTAPLLWPLALATVLRVIGQLAGIAILVVAMLGVSGQLSLWAALGTMVALALAKAVLRYLEQFSGHFVAFAALARLRDLFFARLEPQAPAATEGAGSGELSERATRDIDRVEVFFAHTAPPAVSAVLVPAIALTWLGASQGAALALAIAPFVVLVVFIVPAIGGKASWRASQQAVAAKGVVAQHVSDSVVGVREVLAFEHGAARLEDMDARSEAGVRSSSLASRISAVRGALVVLLQWGSVLAALVVGSVGVVDGTQTWTQLLVALAVAVGLFVPTRAVESFVTDLNASFASAARLREIMERLPLVTDASAQPRQEAAARTGPNAGPNEGRAHPVALAFEGIDFAYPGGGNAASSKDDDAPARTVLKDICFELRAGEHLTVVGPSGSGKSTIASLALRFWDPDRGSVSVRRGPDGEPEPLPRIPLDELRTRTALVSQRPYLSDGTVGQNVALARPGATDEEIFAALRVAALDEWVREQPKGLDTPVRERGGGLSGGQRQRVAIARAVLAGPELLVLDEATSALDGVTERTVRERLAVWAEGRSILEISHRLDALDDTDRVLVLDAGRVVEVGSPEQLRHAGGPFQQLLER
ncbi:thiol reductant ABC exporter subunit CydC [Pseudoclavibacter sp. AY1F1]|uniref:ABC transporter ATP-binding protein n=1 Tax=Pseudoclavibacter sp. AY1F1 TaxID=2080583 RepID=UPI000CE7E2AF|nr:ABC transporter ATP-binding protein [Pseudoclavibacter sp. AY1F1]PPF43806.1 thiol reductant ABC exporter subunit CydC [Pseudoclavibacter sp. AY1F1]